MESTNIDRKAAPASAALKEMILYTADTVGDRLNIHFRFPRIVSGINDLADALDRDCTAVKYAANTRSDANFIEAGALIFTGDSVETVKAAFPSVFFYYTTIVKSDNSFVYFFFPLKEKVSDCDFYMRISQAVTDAAGLKSEKAFLAGGEKTCGCVAGDVLIDERMNIEKPINESTAAGDTAHGATRAPTTPADAAGGKITPPADKSAHEGTRAVLDSSAPEDPILAALEYINPDCDYCTWRNIGMALQAEGYDCSVWIDWSRGAADRYTPGKCESLWRGFNPRENGITGATIIHYAQQAGYIPTGNGYRRRENTPAAGFAAENNVKCVTIKVDEIPLESLKNETCDRYPLTTFLRALYNSDDIVEIVYSAAKNEKGKWHPAGIGKLYRVRNLTATGAEQVLNSVNPEAGAWIRINPVKARTGRDEAVARFQYALVETDSENVPKSRQLGFYRALNLPIAAVVDSGGKSIHAIVKINADDKSEYAERVNFLYDLLEKAGFSPDRADRNPSRLTRLPGARRGENTQRLLDINWGADSWDSWLRDSADMIAKITAPADGKPTSFRPTDGWSGTAQARILAREYSDRIRYAAGIGWVVYDGVKWVSSPDKDNPAAIRVLQELTDLQYRESEAEIEKLENQGAAHIDLRRKGVEKADRELASKYRDALKYRAFIERQREYSGLLSTLGCARGLLSISPDLLDGDPYLLNTPDCTIDLRTGEKRPHNSGDFIMQVTAVSPGEKGREKWQQALSQWFQGDEALIQYVQRVCGTAAVGAIRYESLYIAYGAGKNGKTTFWGILGDILGSYSTVFEPDMLLGGSGNIGAEIAALKGKRLAVAEETGAGAVFNSKMIKTLAGRGKKHAAAKYKAPIDFVSTHTPVLCTNFLPDLNSRDYGTWRRISIIPFSARFESDSPTCRDDCGFQGRIISEAGPAIMQWLIDGAVDAFRLEFQIPEPDCVKAAYAEYKNDNDWLARFIEERCDVSPVFDTNPEPALEEMRGWACRSSELYNAYISWARQGNESVYNNSIFKTEMQRNGFIYRHTRIGWCVYGIQLLPDEGGK